MGVPPNHPLMDGFSTKKPSSYGGTSIYGTPPYGPLTVRAVPQASAHGHTGSALAVGTVTVGAPRDQKRGLEPPHAENVPSGYD
jgi:hypothetical protein